MLGQLADPDRAALAYRIENGESLADRRDGKPVRKMCVLSHDGRELNLGDLTWIDREGESLGFKTAAE